MKTSLKIDYFLAQASAMVAAYLTCMSILPSEAGWIITIILMFIALAAMWKNFIWLALAKSEMNKPTYYGTMVMFGACLICVLGFVTQAYTITDQNLALMFGIAWLACSPIVWFSAKKIKPITDF